MLERIPVSIKAVRAAIDIRLETAQALSEQMDAYPLNFIEKALVILRTLRPRELRYWVKAASSCNYGKSVLDEAFPRCDNPDDFSSSKEVLVLNEEPIQALGWTDHRRMVHEGVSRGLIKDWIDRGFERRASARGINLDWSFFEFPRNMQQQGPPSPVWLQ